jgi:hypothetical protein
VLRIWSRCREESHHFDRDETGAGAVTRRDSGSDTGVQSAYRFLKFAQTEIFRHLPFIFTKVKNIRRKTPQFLSK